MARKRQRPILGKEEAEGLDVSESCREFPQGRNVCRGDCGKEWMVALVHLSNRCIETFV